MSLFIYTYGKSKNRFVMGMIPKPTKKAGRSGRSEPFAENGTVRGYRVSFSRPNYFTITPELTQELEL